MAEEERATVRAWRGQFAADFIGEHPSVISLLTSLRRVARAECDTLVTGASGTGKELVARCVHRASRRASKPFVAINCAAIPKDLMESEIFGHARGAFTGATERRLGKFELAQGGTLFLDEIGEMEPMLQSKLLRVLQERELCPVGSSQTIRLDVRIVAATNQDLAGLCQERLFREDLYYRLNVVPLQLPPLCERRDDIALLWSHFLRLANRRHERKLQALTPAAQRAVMAYGWPGNVRELHNVIERIAVLKQADARIELSDLPEFISCLAKSALAAVEQEAVAHCGRLVLPPQLPEEGVDINEMLAEMETRLTLDALTRSHGNKKRAAELLGLKRTTLVERLKKLNLQVPADACGDR